LSAWAATLRIGRALLGLGTSTRRFEPPAVAKSWGWLPQLSLVAATNLYGAALAANASRVGEDWATPAFYVCMALLYLPSAARAMSPVISRRERIGLVLLTTAALFVIRVLREPVFFIDFDEFLHWITANDILQRDQLFTPNSLLPVSPTYPGLEIVTTALINLTGLSVFGAALLLLGIARLLFIAALFLFYEKLSGTPRIAAVGCFIYMGCSTFVFFDSHFAYESLAVTFLALVLLANACVGSDQRCDWRRVLALTIPLLAALAVTHHMTSRMCAGLLSVTVLFDQVRTERPRVWLKAVVVSLAAIGAPLGWSKLMGDPTAGYLGPILTDGLREAAQLTSSLPARKPFTSVDGSVAPLWQRVTTLSAVALVCIGLATGFFRSLSIGAAPHPPGQRRIDLQLLRSWIKGPLLPLTLLTFGYPLSMLFRLTKSGWEIGNRIGPFSFLGVGVVIAVGITDFWYGRSRSLPRVGIISLACAIVLVGGVISAEGPGILVPEHFRVSADAASVEPMGISAATWTRRWLGSGNRFAADRTNRILLATYGRQSIATSLHDGLDPGTAFLSEAMGVEETWVLQKLSIAYLLVDMRITTALPLLGTYFDERYSERPNSAPPRPSALLKFNAIAGVSRPFDNGYMVIFDVRRLHDDQ
jgi:hypothetical protein